jgi:hypothetical protein
VPWARPSRSRSPAAPASVCTYHRRVTDLRLHGRAPGSTPTYAADLGELARVLVVAGVPTGVLVAGVGSRLAMLLLRVTSPDSVVGVESDDGFVIGHVTLSGTYNLLNLGVIVGVVGAAVYVLVSPWLTGPLWFRRLTVSVVAGAFVGSMIIHADGIDFTVLEPLWLAVALFVGLPALFGWVIGPVVDAVDSADSWTRRGRLRWSLPLLVLAFPLGAMAGVVVLLGVAALLPVRRRYLPALTSPVGGTVVRAAFLIIAILAFVALGSDLRELELI